MRKKKVQKFIEQKKEKKREKRLTFEKGGFVRSPFLRKEGKPFSLFVLGREITGNRSRRKGRDLVPGGKEKGPVLRVRKKRRGKDTACSLIHKEGKEKNYVRSQKRKEKRVQMLLFLRQNAPPLCGT